MDSDAPISPAVPFSAPATALSQRRRLVFQNSRQDTLFDYTIGRLLGEESINKAEVTKAFYHSAANVFVVVVGVVAFALYYVFSAFLRPLLWAVLCGVFLFPIKHRSTHVLNTRLRLLQINDTPLWLGFVMMPIHFLSWTSHASESVLRKQWKAMVVMGALLVSVYTVKHVPVFVALQHSLDGLDAASHLMEFMRAYGYVVWSVLAGYLLMVVFFWRGPVRAVMRHLSPVVWAVLLLYLASLVPSYRLSLFILVTALCVVGAFAGRPESYADEVDGEEATSPQDEVDARADSDRDSPTSSILRRSWSNKAARRRSVFVEYLGPELEHTGSYFYAVIWCCAALILYQFPSLLWLSLLPATLILMRIVLDHFNVIQSIQDMFAGPQQLVGNWLHTRRDALVPPPVRALLRFTQQGDKKVVSILLSTTDKFVSLMLILALCISALLVAFFLAVQIQSESAHLVKQVGVLGQHIMTQYPDLQSMWKGDGNATGMLHTMTEQAHEQGRSWIRTGVRSVISGDNEEIEDQLMSAWDHLVSLWANATNSAAGNVTHHNASRLNATAVASHINITSVFTLASHNLDTLHTVMDSAWLVLKGNVRLVLAVVTAVFSTLLDSSTAVLNLAVNIVIFLTSLMYLLASSDRQYIPLTWLTSLMPPEAGAQSQAAASISNAVQGVFGASLKMITFYGLFTFFTHSLFGFKVVFTPAVVAALFAAIPLLGSYWVALPGSLYLALAEESWMKGSLLFGLHFLCYNVVDVAIYAEIKGGGHPYLTGLAVAGGMYIFGLEGAVVGPIILCCGLAAMDIYRSMLNVNLKS